MLLSVKAGDGVPVREADRNLAAHSCHLLHATGRQHHWEGEGSLSIKTFFAGRAHYNVGRGNYAVDESSYLVLNEGQRYSITVDSHKAVESFCLFFARGLAADIERSRTTNAGKLLDAAGDEEPGRIEFYERSYPHAADRVLSPALFRFRSEYPRHREAPGWLLEQFHEIMGLLLEVRDSTHRECQRLANVRPSTREEIYKRIWRARDFAMAFLHEPITLNQMAKAACLSPNHFLRSFREVFGVSPHQFLTDARLSAARGLLESSDIPVMEVCLSVGFSSHGSFSWLFRRKFGIPPSAYRERKR